MKGPTLRETLSKLHADAMIRQAETIRDWPIGRERNEQAQIHVRQSLWEQQVGRISEEVLQRAYSILHFVMPEDGASAADTTPLEALENEAEWERAYYEQLGRQDCTECGDGLCPGGNLNATTPEP